MRRKELFMELKIFTIKDQKAAIYHAPFFKKSHAEAERDFRELVKDDKTMISKYPQDFDLYYIGTYDDSIGQITCLDTPHHILKAADAAQS